MKPMISYRVIDNNNGYDFCIAANSVGHAAAQARRVIAYRQRQLGRKFIQWLTDHQTGGWHNVSIDSPQCRTAVAGRPTPRPERQLPWKQKQAA